MATEINRGFPHENSMKFRTSPDHQRRRQEMTDNILLQVREAVLEELEGAPESFSREELEAVENEILAHTQTVVDALGFDEMGSERALLSHVANARSDTNLLVRERLAPANL
jgi:hypothetical protein